MLSPIRLNAPPHRWTVRWRARIVTVEDRVQDIIGDIFERPPELGISLALVVLQGGDVVAERYGTSPDTPFGPGGPVDPSTRLVSWSTAKSITHAAVGLLVHDGVIDPQAPAAVPAWAGTDKERITLLDLLEMRPGLQFRRGLRRRCPHCIDMLFGSGSDDPRRTPPPCRSTILRAPCGTTRRARPTSSAGSSATPAAANPACVRSYVTACLARSAWSRRSPASMARARGSARRTSMRRPSTTPASVSSTATTGSSAVSGSAGGWVDHGRTFVAHDPTDGVPGGFDYGRHWWMWPEFPGSIAAHGYEGQYIVVVPDRELVVVHLGKTDATVRAALVAQLHELVRAV